VLSSTISIATPSQRANRFALLISAAFLAASGFVVSHHELWGDEVQSWLLARESTSVLDLLVRQKYEGHPALWQVLLMPLAHSFGTPRAMQILHLLIATSTVFLFVRWSPFTRLQKILFSFGYFPFYEYTVISRSYGLCLLLLTAFCCLYPHRHRHIVSLAGILALLSHSHALGLILALLLFGAVLLEKFLTAEDRLPRRAPVPFLCACALMGIGIATAIIQIKPPEDTGFAVGWQLGYSYDALRGAAKALAGGYLPIPRIGPNYWNNPAVLDHTLVKLPAYLAAATYVFFVAASLRRHWPACLFFAAGTAALLVFYYAKYPGYARHHGFLFACLVVAAWMERSANPRPDRHPSQSAVLGRLRAFDTSLTVLLVVHVTAAGIAGVLECRHPFSAAPAVTDFLHRNGYDNNPLVGHRDFAAMTLLGSSARRQIYYPQSGRWGSYIIWNRARLNDPSDQQIIESAHELARREGRSALLVLDRALDESLVRSNQLTMLGRFAGTVLAHENFHVYRTN
jgi:hypothetical protein